MEDTSFQAPANQFGYSSPEQQKNPKRFIYLIIFLVILGAFFLIRGLFFGSAEEKQVPEITPTPVEYQFPTEAPTPIPTDAVEEPTASPTASAKDSVDSATGLDRSNLSVEIQNGSGEVGAAGEAADVLKDLGYEIASTGNADSYDYEDVTIMVKSTKANYLPLLKKDLGFSYTVGETSEDLDSSSDADALVIIGK